MLYAIPGEYPRATSVVGLDLLGAAPHYQRLLYFPISHKKEGAAWKSFVNGKQFIPDRNNVPEASVFSTLSDIAA